MAGTLGNGRPSKLTPEIQSKIIEHVRNGTPQKYAAAAAGIKEPTLKTWLARGRKEESGIFSDFASALKDALGEFVARNVQIIQNAAEGVIEETIRETTTPAGVRETVTTTRLVFEWTAAAWLLERRSQEDFSNAKSELLLLKKQLVSTNEKLEAVVRAQQSINPAPLATPGTAGGEDSVDGRADESAVR